MTRRSPWRPPPWKRPAIVHAKRVRELNRLRSQAERLDADRAAKEQARAPAPRGSEPGQ